MNFLDAEVAVSFSRAALNDLDAFLRLLSVLSEIC